MQKTIHLKGFISVLGMQQTACLSKFRHAWSCAHAIAHLIWWSLHGVRRKRRQRKKTYRKADWNPRSLLILNLNSVRHGMNHELGGWLKFLERICWTGSENFDFGWGLCHWWSIFPSQGGKGGGGGQRTFGENGKLHNHSIKSILYFKWVMMH